jgi:hypothetical protein
MPHCWQVFAVLPMPVSKSQNIIFSNQRHRIFSDRPLNWQDCCNARAQGESQGALSMGIELKFEILILVGYFAARHLWRVFGKPPPYSDVNNDSPNW